MWFEFGLGLEKFYNLLVFCYAFPNPTQTAINLYVATLKMPRRMIRI